MRDLTLLHKYGSYSRTPIIEDSLVRPNSTEVLLLGSTLKKEIKDSGT